jgi:hypothetical protein
VGKWQLRTWTKGTGAAVEPVGAGDRAPVPAQPGRLRALPPRGEWTAAPEGRDAPRGRHRTKLDARRRHASRYVDERAIERLEQLEADLLDSRGG